MVAFTFSKIRIFYGMKLYFMTDTLSKSPIMVCWDIKTMLGYKKDTKLSEKDTTPVMLKLSKSF